MLPVSSLQSTDTTTDLVNTEDLLLMPPIWLEETTTRNEERDADGRVVGYTEQTSGYRYTCINRYDTDMNLLETRFQSLDGDYWTTTRSTTSLADGSRMHIDTTTGGNRDYTYTSVSQFDELWQNTSYTYRDSYGSTYQSSQRVMQDPAGVVTGYQVEYSGQDQDGYQSSSLATYDGSWHLQHASYHDSRGYASEYHTTVITRADGKITGYVTEGSGQNGTTGPTFTSTEEFDADYTLIHSSYSDSAGNASSYDYQVLHDSTGAITGYRMTHSWTTEGHSREYTQEFDVNWHQVGGDYPDTPVRIDDGVMIMPLGVTDAGAMALPVAGTVMTLLANTGLNDIDSLLATPLPAGEADDEGMNDNDTSNLLASLDLSIMQADVAWAMTGTEFTEIELVGPPLQLPAVLLMA